jgi:orotidine-5'-phosphate decarboxylase
MSKVHKISYSERARAHTNPAAKKLLETMERKQSNLCLSIDVTNKADLLHIVDAVGPQLCLLKVGFRKDILQYHLHLFNN